jgi:DNA repair protein RecO (recombination protein O)
MTSRVPRVTKSDAIVLRHRRLGDADRIVTLITPLRGKLDTVAKGALRVRSKLAGHLEPLTHLEIALAHGRSMDIVTQAQTRHSFGGVRGDLERLASAIYFLELVDRLTVEHAEARGVYELLFDALTALDRGDGVNFVARTFELRLLELAGFRPELQQCVSCGREVAADEALWSALGGGVLGRECAEPEEQLRPVDAKALRVLRAFQQQPYEEAARIRLDDELAAQLENLMHTLTQAASERELKSAQFVAATRRAGRAEREAAEAAEAVAELEEEGGR